MTSCHTSQCYIGETLKYVYISVLTFTTQYSSTHENISSLHSLKGDGWVAVNMEFIYKLWRKSEWIVWEFTKRQPAAQAIPPTASFLLGVNGPCVTPVCQLHVQPLPRSKAIGLSPLLSPISSVGEATGENPIRQKVDIDLAHMYRPVAACTQVA